MKNSKNQLLFKVVAFPRLHFSQEKVDPKFTVFFCVICVPHSSRHYAKSLYFGNPLAPSWAQSVAPNPPNGVKNFVNSSWCARPLAFLLPWSFSWCSIQLLKREAFGPHRLWSPLLKFWNTNTENCQAMYSTKYFMLEDPLACYNDRIIIYWCRCFIVSLRLLTFQNWLKSTAQHMSNVYVCNVTCNLNIASTGDASSIHCVPTLTAWYSYIRLDEATNTLPGRRASKRARSTRVTLFTVRTSAASPSLSRCGQAQ